MVFSIGSDPIETVLKTQKKEAALTPPLAVRSDPLVFLFLELVHGVVFTAGFQSLIAGEVFFVIITNVGPSQVLVLDRAWSRRIS